MNVLGLSFFYHDSSAALVKDGVLIAAAEEERFSRRKHDSGFPALAIQFCLKQGGLTIDDVDFVVFYEKPFVKFERMLITAMSTFPRSSAVFRESMQRWISGKLWIKAANLNEELRVELYKKDGFAVSTYAGAREASYRKKEENTRGRIPCLPDALDPRRPRSKCELSNLLGAKDDNVLHFLSKPQA